MPVRVFHCDDSSAFRVLVREMLQEYRDIELVGEAAGLQEAVAQLPAARPDVVLVDLLERGREAELLSLLRRAAPHARLLLYTGMPATHVPPGFEGHVHKSAPFAELHRTIVALAGSA